MSFWHFLFLKKMYIWVKNMMLTWICYTLNYNIKIIDHCLVCFISSRVCCSWEGQSPEISSEKYWEPSWVIEQPRNIATKGRDRTTRRFKLCWYMTWPCVSHTLIFPFLGIDLIWEMFPHNLLSRKRREGRAVECEVKGFIRAWALAFENLKYKVHRMKLCMFLLGSIKWRNKGTFHVGVEHDSWSNSSVHDFKCWIINWKCVMIGIFCVSIVTRW